MTTPLNLQPDFIEIAQLIHAARQRAVLVVNTALIELYWQVGQFISRKIAGGIGWWGARSPVGRVSAA